MANEHSGISRRKLLYTAAIGVPAAGALGLGANFAAASVAQPTLEADGWWGQQTTVQLQKFIFTLYAQELGKPTYGYEEGIIKFQPAIRKKENPGLGSGWDWAADDGTQGYDFTIYYLQRWLGVETEGLIGPNTIKALQTHYGITADGRLDGPSDTIKALQNELNQHVS